MLTQEEKFKLERIIFDYEEALRDAKKLQGRLRFLGMMTKAKSIQYDIDELEDILRVNRKRLKEG